MSEPTISVRQRQEHFVRLLAAQAQKYEDYKQRKAIWTVGTVLLTIVGTLLVGAYDLFAPYVAVLSVLILFGEFSLLKLITGLREEAARIQETYDCELLVIPWNETAPQRPDNEGINQAANKYLAKADAKEVERLRTWYASELAEKPLREARVLCQKENLWWDSKLRNEWSWCVVGSLILLFVTIIIIAIALEMQVSVFLIGPFLLALPVISSGIRNAEGQRKPAKTLNDLKHYSNDLLARAKDPAVSDQELQFGSRLLQDKIFQGRSENPAVPSWFYNWRRPGFESEANQPDFFTTDQ